jgi:transcriptional activator of glycolytic enzymes GCR1
VPPIPAARPSRRRSDLSPTRPVARHRGLHPTLEPIRYRFDWKVITVTDLWTEWSIGLGPSIQQLDFTWGAKCKDQNERQFYSRRLPIIKAIRDLHASGAATSLQQAASQLEKQRVDDPKQVRKDVEEAGGGGHRVEVGVMALFYFYYFMFSMYIQYIYLLRLRARAGTTGACLSSAPYIKTQGSSSG